MSRLSPDKNEDELADLYGYITAIRNSLPWTYRSERTKGLVVEGVTGKVTAGSLGSPIRAMSELEQAWAKSSKVKQL